MSTFEKTVMIVDDALFSRRLTRRILEKAGYKVVAEVESGKDAIKTYLKTRPEIVLMDIIMPQMDGISALKSIREVDPDAKIVIVSSIGSKEQVLEAIQAGAANFILKPFQPDQLIRALEKVQQAASSVA